MDYSKTVNLPSTDFPMKANLPNREPEIHKIWDKAEVYKRLAERKDANGKFVLHDGPPYSNGDIHSGHALNKLLKDFMVKYKSMQGYASPYVPGWDNHGMPIENKVAENFRKKKKHPDKIEMRKACREYAAKWVDTQRDQFKRLGIFGDWDNPYLTMTRDYEATIVKVFGELVEQGYIYRGFKPIHWCINDETALAEAEIEYADHTSNSIFVRFPLVSDPNGIFEGSESSSCYTIIWTTTPWTIPANMAVAVHPEYEYSIIEHDGSSYLLASELVEKAFERMEIEGYKEKKRIKGSELEGLVFNHPVFDRESVLVHADYVTLEDGTGVVHTAPGHGREDFETGKRYGLEPLNPVNGSGYFTKDAHQFEGMHILRQGNQAVIDALSEAGNLLAHGKVDHSYPHCWRCQNPLVFRTTVQWFMSLDHNDLRKNMLAEMDKIDWFPKEGRNRLTAMLENSPDWCLSRQRSWGVGIPVFFCKECSEPVLDKKAIDSVYEDALQNGSDSWFEKNAADILPDGYKCPKCGGTEFTKETDVLDVWFDSGSSSHAVCENRPELGYPADVYCEGSDQHRGWFNKSLVVGMATKGESPFKQLISHGFVLDAEGKAMSKSKGNVIAPQSVINNVGADVLRLFISSVDYFEDVRMGDEILKRITDAYRRIRNTFRFILGNLSDFDPAKDSVPYAEMTELDRYILHRLQELTDYVTKSYDKYEFHRVYHSVHNFCAVDLSNLYLDIIKDRLYASGADWKIRRSAQTALYEVANVIVRLVAPIISHTAEEVWQNLPGQSREDSVFLAEFSMVNEEYMDKGLAEKWEKLLEVRDKVLLALEEARQSGKISKPMEAKIVLHAPRETFDLLKPYKDLLANYCIVSQAELAETNGEFAVEVTTALGEKCARCWLVLESVGTHEDHPTICTRCREAILK